MIRLFKKRENQNEKLLKNIEKYDEKKKIEQQESKIYGQKLVKGAKNKREKTNVYDSSRS